MLTVGMVTWSCRDASDGRKKSGVVAIVVAFFGQETTA
jgi:hypothetical protein